jgi:hypothetical protein
MIYGCESSQRAWQGAGLEHIITSHNHHMSSAKEFIFNVCRYRDPKEAGQVAMLVWTIWNNRNNWVWNNDKEHGQQLGYKALSLWHEWYAVQSVYISGEQQV